MKTVNCLNDWWSFFLRVIIPSTLRLRAMATNIVNQIKTLSFNTPAFAVPRVVFHEKEGTVFEAVRKWLL